MEQSNINLKESHEWNTENLTPQKIYYDESTRIRVFSEQLQDEFVQNINKRNYEFHVCLYMKYGNRLNEKFPTKTPVINEAIMNFWQKVQIKIKEQSQK